MKNAPEGKYSEIVAEVKNCLAIILGNAQLILRSANLTEAEKEELGQIKKTIWRIDGLLEKIE